MAARRRPESTDDFGSEEEDTDSDSQASEPTRATLVYAGLHELDEHGEDLFHAIVTETFQIGREHENNLVIRDDTKVSRRHAEIVRQGVDYVIRDKDSSNGTYVNDARVTEATLKVGDVIGIGRRQYTFTIRSN
jgi:hypothetical protein